MNSLAQLLSCENFSQKIFFRCPPFPGAKSLDLDSSTTASVWRGYLPHERVSSPDAKTVIRPRRHSLLTSSRVARFTNKSSSKSRATKF